jgi:hypothetical protein
MNIDLILVINNIIVVILYAVSVIENIILKRFIKGLLEQM